MEAEKISDWIRDYANNSKMKTLIVGVSGGIDSALVSTLCAMTGLPTILVSMPILQKSDQLNRATNHMDWLCSKYDNVRKETHDLTDTFNIFKETFNQEDNLSLANLRSRLRMCCLYYIAGCNRGLVIGTGNKVEDFGIGFFTKYGDGGVDLSPIADLTKTEVRQIAKSLGVSIDIIEAKPTDGLWEDDRSDEDQIGATYEELEWAMEWLSSNDGSSLSERQKEVIAIYDNLHTANLHKMINIPIYKKNENL